MVPYRPAFRLALGYLFQKQGCKCFLFCGFICGRCLGRGTWGAWHCGRVDALGIGDVYRLQLAADHHAHTVAAALQALRNNGGLNVRAIPFGTLGILAQLAGASAIWVFGFPFGLSDV